MNVLQADNGLTYYLHRRYDEFEHNQHMIALIVRAGSNNEEVNEQGISHFLEHMHVHIMPWIPYVKDRILEPINYAYTNFNETVYLFFKRTIGNENEKRFVEGCVNTIRHILCKDFLSEDFIPHVRKEVLREYEKTDSAKAIVIKSLFSTESYDAVLSIGDVKCINQFNINGLIAYHKRMYFPQNAAIVVSNTLDTQQTADIITETFSEQSDISHILRDLFQTAITEQTLPYAKVQKYANNDDYLKIYFLSKTKREWLSLNNYIEDSLCIHLAIDALKLIANDYLYENNIIAPIINGSVEVFSYDWYIVRFNIVFEDGAGFTEKYLEQCIKKFKLEENVYSQVNINFIKVIETHPKYDVFQLLNECIQHYLYNEPILTLDDEMNHICLAIENINYDRVKKRFDEIVENFTVIV